MTSVTIPYRGLDVDIEIDASGEIFRASTLNISKAVGSEDIEQLGTDDTDTVRTTIKYNWAITVQELAGNLTSFDAWSDGDTTFNIGVTKGATSILLTNAKCFNMVNDHSTGTVSTLSIDGTFDDII